MIGTLPRPRPPNLSVAARKQHTFVSVPMLITWTTSKKDHVFDSRGSPLALVQQLHLDPLFY